MNNDVPEVHPEGKSFLLRIAFKSELFPVPLGDATAKQTSGRFAYQISISKYFNFNLSLL